MRGSALHRLHRQTRRSFALALLAACAAVAPAQAAFDEIVLSPRARAMGGTAVAVPGDAWSWANNPGALGMLGQGHLASSTLQPHSAEFHRLTGAAGSWGNGRGQGVALGLSNYSVEYKGTTLTREMALGFGHGMRLFEDATSSAHVGWAVNFYNLDYASTVGDVDPGEAWAVGLDVGAVVTVYQRTRVGFLAHNVNHPTIGVDGEELPQMVSAGLAYEPYAGVVTAFDIRSRLGQELRFHGGMELGVTEVLDLRVGIETDPNKLTGGFGVNLPGQFALQYAFSTGGGVLDSSHQFGLAVGLGD